MLNQVFDHIIAKPTPPINTSLIYERKGSFLYEETIFYILGQDYEFIVSTQPLSKKKKKTIFSK